MIVAAQVAKTAKAHRSRIVAVPAGTITTRLLRVSAVLFVVSAFLPAVSAEDNNAVISNLELALHDSAQEFAKAHRKKLAEVISAVLESAPYVGKHKEESCGDHLRTVFRERYNFAAFATEDEFDVFLDQFRVDLENLIRVPSLTESDLKASKKLRNEVLAGVSQFVNSAYTDTPPEHQQAIIAGVTERVSNELLAKCGNYFHPRLLRPDPTDASSISEGLKSSPFLSGSGTRFSQVPDQKGHVAIFVDTEASTILAALSLGVIKSTEFDPDALAELAPETITKFNDVAKDIGERLVIEGAKRREEATQRAATELEEDRARDVYMNEEERTALMDVPVSDGVVQVPESFSGANVEPAAPIGDGAAVLRNRILVALAVVMSLLFGRLFLYGRASGGEPR